MFIFFSWCASIRTCLSNCLLGLYYLPADNCCKSVSSSIHTGHRLVKINHFFPCNLSCMGAHIVEPRMYSIAVIILLLPTFVITYQWNRWMHMFMLVLVPLCCTFLGLYSCYKKLGRWVTDLDTAQSPPPTHTGMVAPIQALICALRPYMRGLSTTCRLTHAD